MSLYDLTYHRLFIICDILLISFIAISAVMDIIRASGRMPRMSNKPSGVPATGMQKLSAIHLKWGLILTFQVLLAVVLFGLTSWKVFLIFEAGILPLLIIHWSGAVRQCSTPSLNIQKEQLRTEMLTKTGALIAYLDTKLLLVILYRDLRNAVITLESFGFMTLFLEIVGIYLVVSHLILGIKNNAAPFEQTGISGSDPAGETVEVLPLNRNKPWVGMLFLLTAFVGLAIYLIGNNLQSKYGLGQSTLIFNAQVFSNVPLKLAYSIDGNPQRIIGIGLFIAGLGMALSRRSRTKETSNLSVLMLSASSVLVLTFFLISGFTTLSLPKTLVTTQLSLYLINSVKSMFLFLPLAMLISVLHESKRQAKSSASGRVLAGSLILVFLMGLLAAVYYVLIDMNLFIAVYCLGFSFGMLGLMISSVMNQTARNIADGHKSPAWMIPGVLLGSVLFIIGMRSEQTDLLCVGYVLLIACIVVWTFVNTRKKALQ